MSHRNWMSRHIKMLHLRQSWGLKAWSRFRLANILPLSVKVERTETTSSLVDPRMSSPAILEQKSKSETQTEAWMRVVGATVLGSHYAVLGGENAPKVDGGNSNSSSRHGGSSIRNKSANISWNKSWCKIARYFLHQVRYIIPDYPPANIPDVAALGNCVTSYRGRLRPLPKPYNVLAGSIGRNVNKRWMKSPNLYPNQICQYRQKISRMRRTGRRQKNLKIAKHAKRGKGGRKFTNFFTPKRGANKAWLEKTFIWTKMCPEKPQFWSETHIYIFQSNII